MTNLLAILVSLAMLLTGATAPVAEPVSRTLQVSNLTVRHNDEEVTLSPYASLGVMTDGERAVLDFFVGNGDETLLPLQLTADENGLLLLADNANVTLKIDRDRLDELVGALPADEDSKAMLPLLADYINAYAGLIGLMNDPEAMAEIQAKGDAIYDELVDRGEGQPDTLEYDDETYDVMTYEYDLTAAQLGALVDALYASDPRLEAYSETYFRLLGALPEDSGLSGFDSFASLLEMYDSFSLRVVESIADTGLDISDMVLTVALPEIETPLEFVIHSVKNGEDSAGELTADFDIDGQIVSMYMEAEKTGLDMDMDLSLTMNPAPDEEDEEEPVDDEDEEIIDDEDEEIIDDEDEEIIDDEELVDDEDEVGGEGDTEDAIAFNMDYERSVDEDTGVVAQSLGYALDLADNDLHAEFSIDGDGDAYQLMGDYDIGEDYYGFECTLDVSDEPIEARADEAGAVSLDDFEPTTLLAGLSADAMKLYGDESVQKVVALVQSAAPAAVEEPFPDDADDKLPAFGAPQFDWLPEGYEVRDLAVDDESLNASCTLYNEATDDSIYVDVSAAVTYADRSEHYVLGPDGSIEPIDGTILNAEIGDAYSIYTVDDGALSISVYRGSDDVSTEDIAHILSSISFD